MIQGCSRRGTGEDNLEVQYMITGHHHDDTPKAELSYNRVLGINSLPGGQNPQGFIYSGREPRESRRQKFHLRKVSLLSCFRRYLAREVLEMQCTGAAFDPARASGETSFPLGRKNTFPRVWIGACIGRIVQGSNDLREKALRRQGGASEALYGIFLLSPKAARSINFPTITRQWRHHLHLPSS